VAVFQQQLEITRTVREQKAAGMALSEAMFEAVVNACYEPLYRFAFSLTTREADARDLTQEAFRQFACKGHQLRDASKAKSWLFTTLYRAFIDARRQQNRYPQVEFEAATQELPSCEPVAADRLDVATACETLLGLPEVFRAPLILFYLEEQSYLQIADVLGIPPGTVMSRISRGRALLRRSMEDKPGSADPLDMTESPVVL
jgi:RNA polymerase sigma-70 factor (ECF subfamily)